MKNNFILFVCMIICLHSFAQSDVATAKYMHVTVDGNDTEWGSLNFYDDQTQLNFAIADDTDNIYLCFSANSQPVQMKFMRAGMKITLSTKGKSKHEASILYPLQQTKLVEFKDSAVNKNNPPEPGERPVFNKETFRQNFIAHHTSMQVSGFANSNGEIPVKDSAIHVAVNWDTASNMVYEVSIAKKEFFGAGYSAKDLLSDITLNVELNGLSHAETGDAKDGNTPSHSNGAHSGMHGGGGGTHGGAGFNGGGEYQKPLSDPMNNTGNVSLNQKTSFKQKFVLNDGSKS